MKQIEEKKESKSVLRTKKKLREGFLQLLDKKKINEITVSELVELVDISRGTFYCYYKDIYDLLEQIENELYSQIETIFSVNECHAEKIVSKILEMLIHNLQVCKLLVGPNGDQSFLNQMKEIVADEFFRIWIEKKLFSDITSNRFTYELYSSYVINGFIGLILTWLNSDLSYTTEQINTLATNIVHANFLALNEMNGFLDTE